MCTNRCPDVATVGSSAIVVHGRKFGVVQTVLEVLGTTDSCNGRGIDRYLSEGSVLDFG